MQRSVARAAARFVFADRASLSDSRRGISTPVILVLCRFPSASFHQTRFCRWTFCAGAGGKLNSASVRAMHEAFVLETLASVHAAFALEVLASVHAATLEAEVCLLFAKELNV